MSEEFTICLADRKIGICCTFEETAARCRDYRTDGEGEIQIAVTRRDLEHEREKAFRGSAVRGDKTAAVSDPELEALALYRKIAETMPAFDTWLMHGSAVSTEGEAVIFAAASGVGKSTHTALWLEQIPGVFVVNGDKPLLNIRNGTCYVCGTPWAGKEGWNRNLLVPLKAICLLSRGKENQIREISFKEAFPVLLQQTYRPEEAEALEKTLGLLQRLDGMVRFYDLVCRPDPEAAQTAYKALFRREGNDGEQNDIL